MREPEPSSSWWNLTSRDRVAEIILIGTVTSPKLIEPVQIALGTEILLGRVGGRISPLQGLLPSQVVATRSKGTGRSGTETLVEVDGRQLRLTNLEKVLYPATGFTKGQVVDYYTRIAPALLPHLRGRPLTLKRYPNGVDGQFFYEKQCPSHRPEWVAVQPIYSHSNDRTVEYCLCDDLAT